MRYSGFSTSAILDRIRSSTPSAFGWAENSKKGCSYFASSSSTISSGVMRAPSYQPNRRDLRSGTAGTSACEPHRSLDRDESAGGRGESIDRAETVSSDLLRSYPAVLPSRNRAVAKASEHG